MKQQLQQKDRKNGVGDLKAFSARRKERKFLSKNKKTNTGFYSFFLFSQYSDFDLMANTAVSLRMKLQRQRNYDQIHSDLCWCVCLCFYFLSRQLWIGKMVQ